jgi:GTP-binding protein HflX
MLEKEVLNFEKTAIVGIVTQNQSEELKEYLDELEFLTFTAGGQVVKRFSQKMERPNPKTFVGTGKKNPSVCKENEISTLIFDDELSHSKKISKVIVECKILDRTHLILDILHKEQRHRMLEPK